MASFSDYGAFIYVNLIFLLFLAVVIHHQRSSEIQENWPQYRCDPSYWMYSKDVSADFTYCAQNAQIGIMGYLMQPITYIVNRVIQSGAELGQDINGVRAMLSTIREFVATIASGIFSVFLNLVIEIQRVTISFKDIVAKIVGIVVALLYILDGSIKTMNSLWKGPSGQVVRAVGSCFVAGTGVELDARGATCAIEKLTPGTVLAGGQTVVAVMHLLNRNERIFALPPEQPAAPGYVLVAGSHFVKHDGAMIRVRDHPRAIQVHDACVRTLWCLITDNGEIPVGGHTFADWEDDHLVDMETAGESAHP